MTLWAALHVFLKWWGCGFVWVGVFFLSNKCFKNQCTRSQKTVLMSGNASPHLESLIFFSGTVLRENFKLCFGICLKEEKFINC